MATGERLGKESWGEEPVRKPATAVPVPVRGADGQQRAGHRTEVKGLIQVLTVT